MKKLSEVNKIHLQEISPHNLESYVINNTTHKVSSQPDQVRFRLMNLEVLDYLLTSDELEKNLTIDFNDNFLFKTACDNKNIEAIIYFLEKKEFQEKIGIELIQKEISKVIEINSKENPSYRYNIVGGNIEDLILDKAVRDLIRNSIPYIEVIKNTIYYKNLEGLKKLLLSKELNINIHMNNDYLIRKFMSEAHLEMIIFLLTSDKLKEYANIHANKDNGFKALYEELVISKTIKEEDQEEEIISIFNYLIFDYKMEYTDEIQHYLNEFEDKEIQEFFEKRNLNDKLESDLKVKNNKKLKQGKI